MPTQPSISTPVSITRLQSDPPAGPSPDTVEGFSWFGEAPTPPLPHDRAALEHGVKTLRLVLEVLSCRRPLAQLAPLLAPQVRRYLAAHLPGSGAVCDAVQLGGVRMCQPHAHAAELAATYRRGRRVGALAARLDTCAEHPDRWQLTALRLG